MRPRILAIDDEDEWLDNYKAWIPDEIADQDSASTSEQAVELLKKRRYDLVLLDLSMVIGDTLNRDNMAIQEYLATKPEGTLYIIVSGVVEKTEVRDLAFRYNAYDIVFKPESEPAIIREKVKSAIDRSNVRTQPFVVDARKKLIPDQIFEHNILRALDPGGAAGLSRVTDILLDKIAPLVPHNNRGSFHISNGCVLGLVWSRLLGKAVSILLANKQLTSEDAASLELTAWLGYEHQPTPIVSVEVGDIRIKVFDEPNISDTNFDLPVISLS